MAICNTGTGTGTGTHINNASLVGAAVLYDQRCGSPQSQDSGLGKIAAPSSSSWLSFRGLRSQKSSVLFEIEINKQNELFSPSPLKLSAAMGLAQEIMTALVYGRCSPLQNMTA